MAEADKFDRFTNLPLADMDADDAEMDSLSTEASDLVEVSAEQLEGRKRRITATIEIPHAVEHVWQILTDYDRLADFIPNLTKSRQIEHPQGGIRLEQVGTESFLRLRFCARVVLDMIEHFPNRLDFQMVDGDFKEFSGSWHLQPKASSQSNTELCYTVLILPPRTMPVSIIERRLKQGLVLNLLAIHQRADELFGQ